AAPETKVRLDLQRRFDVGDQELTVTVDGEVLHRVVVRRLGERVPAEGVVAGPDRDPTVDEVGAVLRVEQQGERVGDLGADDGEGVPSLFVEGSPEPIPQLVPRVWIDGEVD